jgi:hypothetical protein
MALIAFILISLIFFHPILEGKKLKQSDVMIFRGMSKEIRDFRDETEQRSTLWTNGMFSGMPAYFIFQQGSQITGLKKSIRYHQA